MNGGAVRAPPFSFYGRQLCGGTAMTNNPSSPRSGLRVAGIVVAGVGVLLTLYVLSSGPVGRLLPPMLPAAIGPSSFPVWQTVYAPLLWVTDRSPAAAKFAISYLQGCGAVHAAFWVELRQEWHNHLLLTL